MSTRAHNLPFRAFVGPRSPSTRAPAANAKRTGHVWRYVVELFTAPPAQTELGRAYALAFATTPVRPYRSANS